MYELLISSVQKQLECIYENTCSKLWQKTIFFIHLCWLKNEENSTRVVNDKKTNIFSRHVFVQNIHIFVLDIPIWQFKVRPNTKRKVFKLKWYYAYARSNRSIKYHQTTCAQTLLVWIHTDANDISFLCKL